MLFLLMSCTSTHPKTDIHIWMHDKVDPSLCSNNNYGIYRVITCTDQSTALCTPGVGEYEEFISYCSDEIKGMLGVDSGELYQLLKDRAKNKTF